MAVERFTDAVVARAAGMVEKLGGNVPAAASKLEMTVAMLNRILRQKDLGSRRVMLARPWPARERLALEAPAEFWPDEALSEWATEAFLDDSSRVYNPEHAHLADMHVGWMWTNVFQSKHGRRIVGTAEIPTVQGTKWVKARAAQQMREWFGKMPDFVITLDAQYAMECSDATFLAVCDHEMCHCAQKFDSQGEPMYKEDGTPVGALRAHDVEEFVSVVRRWGTSATGVKALVDAANAAPLLGKADIEFACGVCMRAA